jgi:hypothetical protein
MTFNNNTELLMYQTEDGKTKIEVRMEDETVWLSLNQMAELFQRDESVISRHIKNIFSEGELDEKSVVANFATTAVDGKMLIKHQQAAPIAIAIHEKCKERNKNELSAVERHCESSN